MLILLSLGLFDVAARFDGLISADAAAAVAAVLAVIALLLAFLAATGRGINLP